MLHKIRHAMHEEDASALLSGFVQVHDACYEMEHNTIYYREPRERLMLIGAGMNEENQPAYWDNKSKNHKENAPYIS